MSYAVILYFLIHVLKGAIYLSDFTYVFLNAVLKPCLTMANALSPSLRMHKSGGSALFKWRRAQSGTGVKQA